MRSIALGLALFVAFLVVSGASNRMRAVAEAASSSKCDGLQITVGRAPRCIIQGEAFKDCPQCPEMVVVPAGELLMGSPIGEAERQNFEGPQHRVLIARPIAIGKYEVTFAEWDACADDGGCKYRPRDSGWGRGRQPAINVSWDDLTSEYLPWLSRKSGQTYRLLSEAEWEYAARAGTTTPFSTGSIITTDQANFDGTNTYGGSAKGKFRQRPLEVGSFPANAFGLYDMHGNVWEWVFDCFASSYDHVPSDGHATAESPGCSRVMRGGSWIDRPGVLRSACRSHVLSNTRFIYRGFRVARTL